MKIELENKIAELETGLSELAKDLAGLKNMIAGLCDCKEENKPIGQSLAGWVFYVSAGHGNFHNGKYHTFPEDGKFYTFTDAQGKEIETAYEGFYNRKTAKLFEESVLAKGAQVVKCYHDVNDMRLHQRVAIANQHYAGEEKRLFIDFHSNAMGSRSKGTSQPARGVCVFTSMGATYSDTIANAMHRTFMKNLDKSSFKGEVQNRGILQANFTTLAATEMPAVLWENLFFTNIDDVQLLKSDAYQSLFVKSLIEGIESL